MQILRLLKQQKDGCCHCRCLAIVFLPPYLCQKPQKQHPERPYGSNPASGQHDIEKEQTAGQNRSRYDSKQKPPHQPVYPHPDHCSMKPRLGFYPVNNIASSFLFIIKWHCGPYRGIRDGVWGILMRFGGYAYTTEIMWIIYVIFITKNSMAVKPQPRYFSTNNLLFIFTFFIQTHTRIKFQKNSIKIFF